MPETEETEQSAEEQPEPQETDAEQPPEGGATDPWHDPDKARKEIEKLRREAAKHRTKAKELEPLAEKAREAEEAQKSEAERLTGQLRAAEERIAAIQQRTVRAEVKALAAAEFADPEDAHAFLDLGGYVDEDGDVDTSAISKDLKDLLKRKPHLAKPADTGSRRPAPDRSQGSSGNGNRTPNDPAAVFADFMRQGLERGH
ncbi:hypothetical protein ADK70_12420 [Streptomyces rimosus subsp. pseudoverticillatus]|uniref:hypothetical protein n=1 Tax=Streptomyces rimosus TaxID=1927 RepID=UPI0006B27D59|nr:hypothetical protein [Streptomyces rimosus]KOT94480.1 hypothetical protein ADK70_12420 [Streptomyces rimosus subsp. pseudoverticillatus]